MDTLHERLAELADQAPTGGAPPEELWARGRRAHRLRVTAVAATVVVIGAVGAGIGLGVSDDGRDRSEPQPAETVSEPQPAEIVDVSLPIAYPVGEQLPDLGATPGPLVAIWVTPREGGGAAEVVGLVAKTGEFGTLPIDLELDVEHGPGADPGVALSPDGRLISYHPRTGGQDEVVVVVQDLVSGEEEFPRIADHALYPYDWMDATHLYGSASGPFGVSDSDGWVWEPGTAAKLVNFVGYPKPGHAYLGAGWPYGGATLTIGHQGPPRPCVEPLVIREKTTENPDGQYFAVPVLCDVLGVVGTEVLLGHWKTGRLAGKANDPEYADGTVVALDIRGAGRPNVNPALRGPDADRAFEDPARRHVIVTAGAPHRVTFATYLISDALVAPGGAS
jgi:hypothetical protein